MKRTTLLLMLSAACSFVLAQNPVQQKYAQEITKESSYKHLDVLTSKDFAGRGTNQEGGVKTQNYIETEFKKMGLKGPVNGGYKQPVKLLSSVFEVKEFALAGNKLTAGKDFIANGSQSLSTVQAKDVVFVGYGVSDEKFDELKGLDLKDKVVLVINEGEPVDADGNSLITGTKTLSDWANPRSNKRMQAIAAKGPKMILVTSSAIDANIERAGAAASRSRISIEGGQVANAAAASPMVFNLTTAAADLLLKKGKTSIADFKAKIASTKKAQSKKINAAVKATAGVVATPFTDHNVMGLLEGTTKKDEIVVVMGHFDHDGINAQGVFFPGADDNGSGTVGVIEIARAFAKAAQEGHKLQRSILFIGLCAEEKGLIGSDYYSQNPIFPLANTVAAINLDMIGRIDDMHLRGNHNYIHVIGSDKLSSELHTIILDANADYTHMELDLTYNDPEDPNRIYYRSDHYNFAKHGIPSVFFFSGLHPHYHTPEDTIEKIDFDMMVKRARLVFHSAWEVANRDGRLVVDSNKK
jgi:hypothetical protein